MKTHPNAARSVFLSALLSTTAPAVLAATDYVVTPLQGDVISADTIVPTAISATGTITGDAFILDSYKAAIWDNAGVPRELFPLDIYESMAFDINAKDQVLISGPRIWENGVVTPVYVNVVGGTIDGPSVLNDAGQVAGTGYFVVGSGYQRHAVLVTNGVTTDLGVLPGTTTSWATGINNNGDVVGYSYTTYETRRATLWRNGSIIDLGVLPGQSESTAVDINDNGRVVGTSGGRLFTWENGVITDLGTMGATTTTTARAINNKGEIVGLAGKSFLWSNGVFTDLSAVLGYGGGCDPVDINDAGQIALSCGGSGYRLTPAAPASDLSVALTTGSYHATVGSPITYTLSVSNLGSLAASNVTVNNLLPSSVTFISATPSQGSCSGSTTVMCNLNSLAGGAKASVQIVVIPTVAGPLQTSTGVAGSAIENNTFNNTTTSYVYVSAATADLGMTMTGTASTVKRKTTITFTMNVKNNGPSSATGVSLYDALPLGAALVSATSTQGSCTGTTTVSCSLGTMLSGATATVKVVVSPINTFNTNTASVTSSTQDNFTSNNAASVTTSVK